MVLNWAAGIVACVFTYIGSTRLLENVVTGTSTSDVLVQNIVPVVLAATVMGIVINVFRG